MYFGKSRSSAIDVIVGRRQDFEMIVRRFRVSPRQVVIHALLDVCERDLPGVVHLARRKISEGEKLAAVDAVMQQDFLRPHALDVDGKSDVITGDDFRELGVIARLDVDELGVGGAGHVGQKRPARRVVNALG